MRLQLSVALATAAMLSSPARADSASGTWTGAVEVRGNYYWERSTRVLAPTIRAEVSAPNGLEVHADYLIDSITSASQAAGLIADVRFTETRHDVGAGLGYEVPLSDASQLRVGARGRVSSEPDYLSRSGGLDLALSLGDRATTLALSGDLVHDTVRMIVRGATRVGPDGRNLSDRGEVGQLDAFVTSLRLTHVLSRVTVAEIGYSLGLVSGFQENAYRQVMAGGTLRPEAHPDERTRHTLHGRIAWYSTATRTALHGLLRGYADSWGIRALTPEARVYQEVSDSAQLRLRYRYYTQSKADFYAEPVQYAADAVFVTADPKMSAFHSHLVGLQLAVGFSFLDASPLAFARDASIDVGFDLVWNTNRYGDGVIAQTGLRVPF